MTQLEKSLEKVDAAGFWIGRILLWASAALVGYLAFKILGTLDYSLMIRLGGAVVIALISLPLLWIFWRIMAFFN